MKLEKQVCSLELARKLRGLGVKQESLFDWVGNSVFPTDRIDFHLEYGDHNYDIYYAAFTVAELGEMLPEYEEWMTAGTTDYPPEGDSSGIQTYHWKCNGLWNSEISSDTFIDGFDFYEVGVFKDKNEADARAKMLIYLLENKLTPASQDKE